MFEIYLFELYSNCVDFLMSPEVYIHKYGPCDMVYIIDAYKNLLV